MSKKASLRREEIETMIIGISGKAGVGKSTLAALLMERLPGYKRLSFADPVKEAASRVFGFPLEWAYTEEGKAREFCSALFGRLMTVREALQITGTDLGRKIDPVIWTRMMDEKMEAETCVIIDDVRFRDEAALISTRPYGFLVRLAPYCGWRPGPNAAHKSETALDDYGGWDRVYKPEYGRLAEVADDIVSFGHGVTK